MKAELRERSAAPLFVTVAVTAILACLYAVGKIKVDWYALPFLTSTLAGLLYTQLRGNPLPRKRSATVTADDAGVHADGTLLVPRARIAQAHFKSSSGMLRLLDRFGFCLLDLEISAAGAAELRVRLGLDAARAAATFALEPTRAVRWAKAGVVLSLGVMFPTLMWLGVPTYTPLLAVAALVYLMKDLPIGRGQARIAPDGIAISGWRRKRFVPFAEVRAARREGTRVVLDLVNDEKVVVDPEDGADGVVTQIEEALSAWRGGGESPNAETLLARSGRTVAAWATALRSLGEEAADYRRAAVSGEALWRILEDPKASSASRGAAAFALRSREGTDAARLIRIKDGIAAPKLRVAVEQIASGSEDAQREEALALLEDEESRVAPPAKRQGSTAKP